MAGARRTVEPSGSSAKGTWSAARCRIIMHGRSPPGAWNVPLSVSSLGNALSLLSRREHTPGRTGGGPRRRAAGEQRARRGPPKERAQGKKERGGSRAPVALEVDCVD